MSTLNLLKWKKDLKIYIIFVYKILRKNLIMLCKWKRLLEVHYENHGEAYFNLSDYDSEYEGREENHQKMHESDVDHANF